MNVQPVRIEAPSRLHFGLLALHESLSRRFGGIGLMIDQPTTVMDVTPADQFGVSGSVAERVREFSDIYCQHTGVSLPSVHLSVTQSAPQHYGFGAGSQLGLVTAKALAHALGETPSSTVLAQRVGRGGRSGIGLHGFEHGGLLVDGGKSPSDAVAPLIVRHPFPDEWRLLVVTPHSLQGLHGGAEEQAMQDLVIPPTQTDKLCRIILMGILPALVSQDCNAFGEAVHQFNYEAGVCFKAAQGGVYANPLLEKIVDYLRSQNCPGAGQSSWGPAVFGVLPNDEAAHALMEKLLSEFEFDEAELLVTKANNTGATVRPLTKNEELKSASGRIQIEDNWQQLEDAELRENG